MKKLLALVLAVCMMFAALPAMAYGEFTGYSIASTTLYGSSSKKIQNIELAARALDGTAVYSGETFSFNEVVGPRTRERGYVSAMNGRGAVVLGGGVSQLATTLLMAIIDSNANGFEIKPFMDYGEDFVDWYADEDDWTVVTDYAAGHDFEFTNWHEEVVYINAWVDEEDVYCELVFGEPGDSIARSSTPIFGSDNKRSNILNAAFAIDGISLDYGEKFSFNEIVGPRTKEAGYLSALNGRGVKVVGGGVAQVASTVYLAVKDLDCVSVDPIKTYGKKFVDGYVSDPDDAIVTDYNAGTDFSFKYRGYGTLRIYLYEDDDRLVCEIYED